MQDALHVLQMLIVCLAMIQMLNNQVQFVSVKVDIMEPLLVHQQRVASYANPSVLAVCQLTDAQHVLIQMLR